MYTVNSYRSSPEPADGFDRVLPARSTLAAGPDAAVPRANHALLTPGARNLLDSDPTQGPNGAHAAASSCRHFSYNETG